MATCIQTNIVLGVVGSGELCVHNTIPWDDCSAEFGFFKRFWQGLLL